MKKELKNGVIVLLREVKKEDAEAVVEYITQVNKETKNLTREPNEFNMTVEQEQKFIERVIESDNEYMVTVWENEKLISVAGIHGSGLRRLRHKVNLGISVLLKYHNLGLGTILMEHLTKKAIEMGKTKIELEVREDNPNAIKVYKREGYVVEGLRKNGFFVDGEYINLVQMGKFL